MMCTTTCQTLSKLVDHQGSTRECQTEFVMIKDDGAKAMKSIFVAKQYYSALHYSATQKGFSAFNNRRISKYRYNRSMF